MNFFFIDNQIDCACFAKLVKDISLQNKNHFREHFLNPLKKIYIYELYNKQESSN